MQYTLRNIPEALDKALREKARRDGKSLNQVAIEALSRALGVGPEAVPYRDLSDIAGTWVEDPEMDQVLEAQRQIDAELWQ